MAEVAIGLITKAATVAAPAAMAAEGVGAAAALGAGTAAVVEGAGAAATVAETAAAIPTIGLQETLGVSADAMATAKTIDSLVPGVKAGTTKFSEGLKTISKEPLPAVGTPTESTSPKPKAENIKGQDGKNSNGAETSPPNPEPATPPQRELTPVQYNERYVTSKLSDWDKKNPKPDKTTDPDGFNKWVQDRNKASDSFLIDAEVSRNLESWDKTHPEPKDQNSAEYNQWMKDRAYEERSTRSRLEPAEGQTETDKNKTEKTQKKELTDAEIIEKTKQLTELKLRRNDIQNGVNTLRLKPDKSETDTVELARFSTALVELDGNIKTLEDELKDALPKASAAMKILIMTAVTLIVGGTIAASAANANK